MTPRTLAEWTIPSILEIITKGIYETEDFDFKAVLPLSADTPGKARVRETCSAFANAGGGFIIYGVHDDRRLTPPDRLKGLESTFDFPQHFGSYPGGCVPSVEWTFMNPPLSLSSGRVIHVVHVPKSWKAPHAVGSAAESWRFMKRTNQGNEGMNIDEIRGSFLSYHEKRLRLQLLRAELLRLHLRAAEAAVTEVHKADTEYSLVTFDVGVIEQILADTYPITASSPHLHEALAELRHEVMIVEQQDQHILFYRCDAAHRESISHPQAQRVHGGEDPSDTVLL